MTALKGYVYARCVNTARKTISCKTINQESFVNKIRWILASLENYQSFHSFAIFFVRLKPLSEHKQAFCVSFNCLDGNETRHFNFTFAFDERSLQRLSVKNTHTFYSVVISYCCSYFFFVLCQDCHK